MKLSYDPKANVAYIRLREREGEVETIEALLRRGALPSPRMIGGLKRWNFASVRAFVEAQDAAAKRLAPNGRPGPEDDPFLAALTNGKADGRGESR